MKKYPIARNGVYRLPLFLHAGATIPLMHVDEQTMIVSGARLDGSVRNEIILRMVAGAQTSKFRLYEDDGVRVAYHPGEARTTRVTMQPQGDRALITVHAAQGTYPGVVNTRNSVHDYSRPTAEKPQFVFLNGSALPEGADGQEWERMDSGWYYDEPGRVLIKTGVL
ncbi:MAG TPA: DUF5110 domain-containing protein, partial [Anaerolineaceae bacterium]|nr:DUF5110 domain-containing protein [Anaerolineaceae bacterium]